MTNEWGCVFHDRKQVWQIITSGGHVLIDNIGEFRYSDRRSARRAIKRLAEQIRDQHNYAVQSLSEQGSGVFEVTNNNVPTYPLTTKQ